MAFSADDTIVAVATPPGRGGIGVVRLSGPQSVDISTRMIPGAIPEPRTATFVRLKDPVEGQVIDHVVLTWFQAPRSFTGDDLVELSAHGSPVVLQKIVELACRMGARLAEPGEFTFRAYINGRLDLVQAEAVGDLIEAVTPLQARVAMDQLEGTLSREFASIDTSLFDIVAKLEASLDFPDEGYHFITPEQTHDQLQAVQTSLDRLIREGRRGRLVREGRMVVIAGRPNVGKSSLFNALVGTGRAIVTPIAGTTRDVLTERVDVNGVPITLVDTAGVREAQDEIEAEGVRRTHGAVDVAALTLLVIDSADPWTHADVELADSIRGPVVVVANKCDLAAVPSTRMNVPQVGVSATKGLGLDSLRDQIVSALAGSDEWRDTPAISNLRHLQCAELALEAVGRAGVAVGAGATEELVLAELGSAREALETLTGRRTPDDVLAHIFSHFCIGK